jgi:hypothetical protein
MQELIDFLMDYQYNIPYANDVRLELYIQNFDLLQNIVRTHLLLDMIY